MRSSCKSLHVNARLPSVSIVDYVSSPECIAISDDSNDMFDYYFENEDTIHSSIKNRSYNLVKDTVTENSQQDSDDTDSVIEIESQQKSTNFIRTQMRKKTSNRTKFLRTLSENDHTSNGSGINNISNKTLTEDAITISKLLSKYNFNRIFEALCQNRHAKNYIELTLWDLLPMKRPPVQRITNENNFGSQFTSVDSLIEEVLRASISGDNPIQHKEDIIAGTKRKVITTNKRDKEENNKENSMLFQNDENWIYDVLQLYVELTCRFPNVDQQWLNNLTRTYKHPKQNATFDEKLKNLISIVEKDATELQSEYVADIDEKFIYLSNIFQNADPDYLKKVVARTRGDVEALQEFIQTQIETPTYITKEEKLKRKNIARYTINFNVKQFLEAIPDPIEFFENQNRKCVYNAEAFEFLKFQFKQFEETTITDVYTQNKYNLTLTACALRTKVPDKRNNHESSWKKKASENIPLLQEVAYIVRKTQIDEEFNRLKEIERKELDLLIRMNEFLECQCCYTECIPSKCLTCDDGHVFCDLCVQRGAEVKMGQGTTRVSCFDSDCTSEFSLTTLQKALKPMVFSLLLRKRQEAEVLAAGLEGLVACPFCYFASIPPVEDKIFKCLNPDCMKESCRYCKRINHLPLKCYEVQSDKARLLLEEKMTEALVRKCYNCGSPYIKEDGCNRITCSCGSEMCYICGIAISGYDHFDQTNSKYCFVC
ncbi:uncharacterized protein LOC108628427 isoform X2 [Ceratina calcarata]|uniref:Uncharacterized protein LOC108628427 isoform X2 n=1 Tax=Ceratina calcarata TaxID=156304 RepID=A0AAJ7WDJ9_9HYME|nr:uncharacterized protein LOC108628427 isoform X2 [Ceratina calcarata]